MNRMFADGMFAVIVGGGVALVACGGATASDLGGDGGTDAADASSDAQLFPEEGVRPFDASIDTIAVDASPDVKHSDAGAFACGPMKTCDGRTEVCKIGYGGVANSPTSYDCVPIPAQCASNATCACIEQALGAQQCSDVNDDVTVDFFYP